MFIPYLLVTLNGSWKTQRWHQNQSAPIYDNSKLIQLVATRCTCYGVWQSPHTTGCWYWASAWRQWRSRGIIKSLALMSNCSGWWLYWQHSPFSVEWRQWHPSCEECIRSSKHSPQVKVLQHNNGGATRAKNLGFLHFGTLLLCLLIWSSTISVFSHK